jgi:hypothetical protein
MLPTAEQVRQARDLAHAARVYLDSEPWIFITEPECFALRDPATDEQVFLSVRGDSDPGPGLALFRGTEGFESMFRLRHRPLESLDEREMLDISGTFVEFRPMSSLPARALRPLAAAGDPFDRDGLAPDFMNYLPGYCPGGPTVDDIRLLTLALHEACDVATAVVEGHLKLAPVDERWIERRIFRNGESWWWEHVRAKPDYAWPPKRQQQRSSIDELTATRLERLPWSGDEIWEVDLVPLTMVQDLGPDERWPILLLQLIVDRSTGLPRHFERVPAPDRYAPAGLRLARAILEVGAKPSQLRVRDQRLRAGIADVARAIDAKLIAMRHLPALDAAHDVMRAFYKQHP